MKCHIQFSRKNKKNITNLSSAESAHIVVGIGIDNSYQMLCPTHEKSPYAICRQHRLITAFIYCLQNLYVVNVNE